MELWTRALREPGAGKTRAELDRILVAGGLAALVWNARRASGTPFLEAYEALPEDARKRVKLSITKRKPARRRR